MSSSTDRSSRTWRRALAVLFGLFCAVAASLLFAAPASAHAELVSSDPANGAALAQAPESVALRFDEEIAVRLSSVRLVDGAGDTVVGTAQHVDRDGRGLSLSLAHATVPEGSYGVLWRIVAEDDGHATSGALAFSVGGSATAPAALAPPRRAAASSGQSTPQPFDVALRWLRLGLLSGVVGGLAVAGPVLSRSSRVSGTAPFAAAMLAARRRVLSLVGLAAAGGVAVGLADPLVQAARVSAPGVGVSLPSLVAQTHWGHLWLAHEAGLVAIVVLAGRLRSNSGSNDLAPDRRATRLPAIPLAGSPLGALAAAVVVELAVVEALGSHAAAVGEPAVAILAAHALVAFTWLGALAALGLLVWPLGRPGVGPLDLVRACGSRLSWLLAGSVTVLVASGLYTAGWQVPRVAGLVSTGYGQTLMVKTGLVVVAMTLGAMNMARLHRLHRLRSVGRRERSARRPMSRRSLLVETGTVLLVIVATAVLAESVPARSTAPPPAAAAARPASGGASVGDLVVSVTVSPNQPGLNALTVRVSSTRRPEPAAVTGISLTLDQAGIGREVTVREITPGQFFGTAVLDVPDGQRAAPIGLSIAVRRSGGPTVVHLPWSVSGPPPAVPPAKEGRRTAPYADGLALAVLALAGIAALAVTRRRGRARDTQRQQEHALEPVR